MLPEQKSTCGHIVFIHKAYNEIVDKSYLLAQKQGKSDILLFLGSSISLLLQIGSSSFQAS